VCFYEASKLTLLLKEALGGNSFTLAMFFLIQGDGQDSLATLRTM